MRGKHKREQITKRQEIWASELESTDKKKRQDKRGRQTRRKVKTEGKEDARKLMSEGGLQEK
jgi:hypothetical protein